MSINAEIYLSCLCRSRLRSPISWHILFSNEIFCKDIFSLSLKFAADVPGMPCTNPGGGGDSLCDGWYICAAVLTPFFHFGRIEHDLFGVFFSSTNSKAIFWGTKTTNFYKNRSFWPQLQFFPRSFWVQFSAASGTPPSVFRPSTPPGTNPNMTFLSVPICLLSISINNISSSSSNSPKSSRTVNSISSCM